MMPMTLNLGVRRGDVVKVFTRLRLYDALGSPGLYMDLTGLTPKAQIRPTVDSNNVTAEFVCTLSNQTVAATKGGVLLYIPSSVTSTFTSGSFVWDFQLTDAVGDVNTYMAGTVIVTGDVTRG